MIANARYPLLVLSMFLVVSPERLVGRQGSSAVVRDTDGNTIELTDVRVSYRLPAESAADTLPRLGKGFSIHLIFYPYPAVTGDPSDRIHQFIDVKLDKIRGLTLSGDWCVSPPTGGIEVTMRDSRRLFLATAGQTNYQVHDPRPRGMGADMPVGAWTLEGESIRGADGQKRPTEIVGIVGQGNADTSVTVSLCKLQALTFK